MAVEGAEARALMFRRLSSGRTPKWANRDEKIAFGKTLRKYRDDPLGFCLWAFPWGVKGTRLEYAMIEGWQARILLSLGRQIRANRHTIRIAVASGHGPGKSALMAMVNIWYTTCHPNPQVITTANTEAQLRNKTWRELKIWLDMSLVAWMFTHTATKLSNKEHPSTWFSSAQTWSESKPEAFAGTHEKHVMLMFDEASGIPTIIWENAFGGLTTKGGIMIVFGNPTLNTGMFFDCFGRFRKRWSTLRVDSRTVSFTNKRLFAEWAHDYGEDSDFFRVRVRGMHPNQSSIQLIGFDVVLEARERVILHEHLSPAAPLIMAADIAREGDDHSSIIWRKGSKMYPFRRYQLRNLMQNASFISEQINTTQADICFVDATGMGQGVVDRLIQLGHEIIVPVHFGEKAYDNKVYVNRRIELWCAMRDWLKDADIPDDQRMSDELCGAEYAFEVRSERMLLEAKKDMKARGLESPDVGDALAISFSHPVPTKMRDTAGMATEPEFV